MRKRQEQRNGPKPPRGNAKAAIQPQMLSRREPAEVLLVPPDPEARPVGHDEVRRREAVGGGQKPPDYRQGA
jgi:hypothetical protein